MSNVKHTQSRHHTQPRVVRRDLGRVFVRWCRRLCLPWRPRDHVRVGSAFEHCECAGDGGGRTAGGVTRDQRRLDADGPTALRHRCPWHRDPWDGCDLVRVGRAIEAAGPPGRDARKGGPTRYRTRENSDGRRVGTAPIDCPPDRQRRVAKGQPRKGGAGSGDRAASGQCVRKRERNVRTGVAGIAGSGGV